MVSEIFFPDVEMEERGQFGELGIYISSLRHWKHGEYWISILFLQSKLGWVCECL